MGVFYHVKAKCLYYIVPFRFTNTFEEACHVVNDQVDTSVRAREVQGSEKEYEERKLWVKRVSTFGGKESDLYQYVRNEYFFDEDENDSELKQGLNWLAWRSKESSEKDNKVIKRILYYPKGIDVDESDRWTIEIANLGLYLFKNNVGFIWYEIELPKWKNGIDTDSLKTFQNRIRELNTSRVSCLWECVEGVPEYGVKISENNGFKKYASPFSFAHWINELLSDLDVNYFAERSDAYGSMIKNSIKGCRSRFDESSILDGNYSGDNGRVPDKAILFTYLSLMDCSNEEEDSNDSRLSLIYHFCNGYKDSYQMGEDVIDEIKHPFKCALWYATQEGAAYVAWPDETNQSTFNTTIVDKIRTDYFKLFIKVLFQSFSLLNFAERIQKEFSVELKNQVSAENDKKIENFFEEINLFLAKNMATSISHIHHQSEFYIFLKERLRIQEDVDSVTAGLNALHSIHSEHRKQNEMREEREREREDEKREKQSDSMLQAMLGLFSLLAITSGLVDGYDIITKLWNDDGEYLSALSANTQTAEFIFIVIYAILACVAIFTAIYAIVRAFKDRSSNHKN